MSEEYQLNPPTLSLYAEKIALKILCENNGFNQFFHSNGWNSDRLALALGLKSEWDNLESIPHIKKAFLKRYQEIKSLSVTMLPEWEIAYQNIDRLAEYIELNDTEKEILTLAFHIQNESIFNLIFDLLDNVSPYMLVQWLSKLLDLDIRETKLALHKNQKIKKYGLIEQNTFHSRDIDDYLQWTNTLDFDVFISEPLTKDKLLSNCIISAQLPSLTFEKFDYIQSMHEMMFDYLQQAVKNQRKGVNILLYGLPGTGKTELALLLGKALNIETYTMHFADEDDETLNGRKRLNNCVLAQKLLQGSKSLIIFDEVEDVFASGFSERSVGQASKAWVNHFLENNDIPMIWITNDVGCIDNAYLRRFDMVFEMPELPIKHKEKLIRELTQGMLSEPYVQHFAQVKALSPALLARTFNVVKTLSEDSETLAKNALSLFNETLRAQGYRKIEPLSETTQADYSLAYVSCKNANIYQVSEGLKRTKRGRICCYGVPGTGKTAWAKWLAEQVEMKPLVLQGSDLLDMYVGGTEKRIAAAFAQAKENNQLLILDEVDTFLFTRQSGQRSWEHSQVNEMLTQLEKFDGLMVVSTNLLDELDPASLRRFDLKLQFDYLNPQQRMALANEQAVKLGLEFTNSAQAEIEQLRHLTPGDFAAVARRHTFAAFSSADEWTNALADECRLKKVENKRAIGFR